MSDELTVFECGPGNKTCRCDCDYQQESGQHDCEHVWDGPWVTFETPEGGGGGSSTCSRCGMSAMSHDMWVGP